MVIHRIQARTPHSAAAALDKHPGCARFDRSLLLPLERVVQCLAQSAGFRRICKIHIRAYKYPAIHQQLSQRVNHMGLWCKAVEEGQVVARCQVLHYDFKRTMVHGDSVRQPNRCDLLARKRYVHGVTFYGVDAHFRSTASQAASGVAQRRSQLEHTVGVALGGQAVKTRAILEGVGPAAMTCAMGTCCLLNG